MNFVNELSKVVLKTIVFKIRHGWFGGVVCGWHNRQVNRDTRDAGDLSGYDQKRELCPHRKKLVNRKNRIFRVLKQNKASAIGGIK